MVLAGLALLANLFSPLSKISLFNAHSNRFASELGIRQVLSTIVDVSTPNGEQSRGRCASIVEFARAVALQSHHVELGHRLANH